MTAQVQEIKTSLAKLLATENLTVEHANVETACFDVKNRVLVCPQFKNMNSDLYDLFIGHEVSHALYTPSEGHDKLVEKGNNYFSFVNVVEDARIERFIQSKYPGLKKCFYKAYGELFDRDFFSIKDKNVNDLLFIDRLNVKAKLGTRVEVEFNEVETEFYNRAMSTVTWEDVIQLTDEIFEYCQKEMEEKQDQNVQAMSDYSAPTPGMNPQPEQGEDSSSDDETIDKIFNEKPKTSQETSEETESSESSETEETGEESPEASPSETQDNSEVTEEDASKKPTDTPVGPQIDMEGSASDEKGILPRALTDIHSNEKMSEFIETDNMNIVQYVDLPKKIELDKFIVPFSKMNSEIREYWKLNQKPELTAEMQKLSREFKKRNEKVIAYLHKEFEMKKAAEQYSRATSSKTGVINTNKLFSYTYNEDLFKKVTSIPNGKNHGMTFFLDWSGSMSDNMKGTIEQLLCLVLFCKKANIPFSVYAFSSEYGDYETRYNIEIRQSRNINEVELGRVTLLQLFHEKMRTSEFNSAVELLLVIAQVFTYHDYRTENVWRYIGLPRQYYLGGTPLDATILLATQVVDKFKKTTGVQIMNTIFLTDGSSHPIDGVMKPSQYNNGSLTDSSIPSYQPVILRDKNTNTQFRMDRKNGDRTMTKGLYQLFKKITGTNLVGFFIASRRDIKYVYANYFRENKQIVEYYEYAEKVNEIKKTLNRDKSLVVTTSGMDELYIIKGGADLQLNDEGLQVDSNASKAKLTTAFKKMTKGKLQNRVVLGKFIEKIAA